MLHDSIMDARSLKDVRTPAVRIPQPGAVMAAKRTADEGPEGDSAKKPRGELITVEGQDGKNQQLIAVRVDLVVLLVVCVS